MTCALIDVVPLVDGDGREVQKQAVRLRSVDDERRRRYATDLGTGVGGDILVPPLPGAGAGCRARDGHEPLGRGGVPEEKRPLTVVYGEGDGEGIEPRP